MPLGSACPIGHRPHSNSALRLRTRPTRSPQMSETDGPTACPSSLIWIRNNFRDLSTVPIDAVAAGWIDDVRKSVGEWVRDYALKKTKVVELVNIDAFVTRTEVLQCCCKSQVVVACA